MSMAEVRLLSRLDSIKNLTNKIGLEGFFLGLGDKIYVDGAMLA